jgi:hypothetical protein
VILVLLRLELFFLIRRGCVIFPGKKQVEVEIIILGEDILLFVKAEEWLELEILLLFDLFKWCFNIEQLEEVSLEVVFDFLDYWLWVLVKQVLHEGEGILDFLLGFIQDFLHDFIQVFLFNFGLLQSLIGHILFVFIVILIHEHVSEILRWSNWFSSMVSCRSGYSCWSIWLWYHNLRDWYRFLDALDWLVFIHFNLVYTLGPQVVLELRVFDNFFASELVGMLAPPLERFKHGPLYSGERHKTDRSAHLVAMVRFILVVSWNVLVPVVVWNAASAVNLVASVALAGVDGHTEADHAVEVRSKFLIFFDAFELVFE